MIGRCPPPQMRLAVREATELSFVPQSLRHLATSDKADSARSEK